MKENEYFRDALFHSNQESLDFSPEESEQPAKKRECCEEVNTKMPFCCTVNVPHGFQYVPQDKPKIAYHVDCLSVIKESCRKTIQVEDCGPVEVTLNLLKVVGCIPYIVNATVKSECGKDCEYDLSGKHHHISVCCSGSICVDNILKCSIECLPHYPIDCHNVVVSDLQVTPIEEHGCQLLQVTGTIEFINIPYI